MCTVSLSVCVCVCVVVRNTVLAYSFGVWVFFFLELEYKIILTPHIIVASEQHISISFCRQHSQYLCAP